MSICPFCLKRVKHGSGNKRKVKGVIIHKTCVASKHQPKKPVIFRNCYFSYGNTEQQLGRTKRKFSWG